MLTRGAQALPSEVWWLEGTLGSAWMSPNSGIKQYQQRRIRALAESGADAVWLDVPLYWASINQFCGTEPAGRAAFKAATGLDVPATVNMADPVFRRWVSWRHKNLKNFIEALASAGKSVRSDFVTIPQVWILDAAIATDEGLDVSYLSRSFGLSPIYEIVWVNFNTGFRQATEDDWVGFIAMCKYARGAMHPAKPSWAYSSGLQTDDAAAVMAEVIAAGNNPYETKAPAKDGGIGSAFRRQAYSFIAKHEALIYGSGTRRSLAQVAVYYSGPTRDFIEGSLTNYGRYCSEASFDEAGDCYSDTYLGEYRGVVRTRPAPPRPAPPHPSPGAFPNASRARLPRAPPQVKALLHAGIPFDVLLAGATEPADLLRYRLQAVSDAEAAGIRAFVAAGGAAVLTGRRPTALNEFGDTRASLALSDLLGFTTAAAAPAQLFPPSSVRPRGLYYFRDEPGRAYMGSGLPGTALYNTLSAPALQPRPPKIKFFELRNDFAPRSPLYNTLSAPALQAGFSWARVSAASDRRVHLEATIASDPNTMVLQARPAPPRRRLQPPSVDPIR
eukprot:tig00020563_g11341.t1